MSQELYKISKSGFLKYDQCPKAFFLYKKFPYLRDPISKEKQLTFNRGHEVGHLAQQLFPGGVDASVDAKGANEVALKTQQLLQNNITTIYEATFVFNSVLIMVDILHFDGTKWNAYEVKSSLKISEVYVKDACLQYYVLKNALPLFSDLFLVTLNGDYVRGDDLELNKLFKKRNISSDAEKNLDFFTHKVSEINLMLEKNVTPEIAIGKHCFSPYACDFTGTCWKNISNEKSVFKIGKSDRDTLFNWYKSGQDTVDKIELTNEIKPHIRIQIECIKENKEYFNSLEIKKLLKNIGINSCFMDMEVWSPAVPKYKGHKPFEQLPFLFSVCHRKNGELNYYHHLISEGSNDIKAFAVALIYALEKFDNVVVYDKNLELQVIAKIESMYPEFSKDFEKIRRKIIDLSDLVQNFFYYNPKFNGNFSLKAVADILDETADYNKLEIQSGITAMYKYEALLNEPNPIIKETHKQQLIDYCNLDTLTCLKFYEYLLEKVREQE